MDQLLQLVFVDEFGRDPMHIERVPLDQLMETVRKMVGSNFELRDELGYPLSEDSAMIAEQVTIGRPGFAWNYKETLDIPPDPYVLNAFPNLSALDSICELVDNAIEATGTIPDERVISVEIIESMGKVIITDNGIGMTRQEVGRLFQLGGHGFAGEASGADGHMGKFGIGFPTATSFIGDSVQVTTRRRGTGIVFRVQGNFADMQQGRHWRTNLESFEDSSHPFGTRIEISSLSDRFFSSLSRTLSTIPTMLAMTYHFFLHPTPWASWKRRSDPSKAVKLTYMYEEETMDIGKQDNDIAAFCRQIEGQGLAENVKIASREIVIGTFAKAVLFYLPIQGMEETMLLSMQSAKYEPGFYCFYLNRYLSEMITDPGMTWNPPRLKPEGRRGQHLQFNMRRFKGFLFFNNECIPHQHKKRIADTCEVLQKHFWDVWKKPDCRDSFISFLEEGGRNDIEGQFEGEDKNAGDFSVLRLKDRVYKSGDKVLVTREAGKLPLWGLIGKFRNDGTRDEPDYRMTILEAGGEEVYDMATADFLKKSEHCIGEKWETYFRAYMQWLRDVRLPHTLVFGNSDAQPITLPASASAPFRMNGDGNLTVSMFSKGGQPDLPKRFKPEMYKMEPQRIYPSVKGKSIYKCVLKLLHEGEQKVELSAKSPYSAFHYLDVELICAGRWVIKAEVTDRGTFQANISHEILLIDEITGISAAWAGGENRISVEATKTTLPLAHVTLLNRTGNIMRPSTNVVARVAVSSSSPLVDCSKLNVAAGANGLKLSNLMLSERRTMEEPSTIVTLTFKISERTCTLTLEIKSGPAKQLEFLSGQQQFDSMLAFGSMLEPITLKARDEFGSPCSTFLVSATPSMARTSIEQSTTTGIVTFANVFQVLGPFGMPFSIAFSIKDGSSHPFTHTLGAVVAPCSLQATVNNEAHDVFYAEVGTDLPINFRVVNGNNKIHTLFTQQLTISNLKGDSILRFKDGEARLVVPVSFERTEFSVGGFGLDTVVRLEGKSARIHSLQLSIPPEIECTRKINVNISYRDRQNQPARSKDNEEDSIQIHSLPSCEIEIAKKTAVPAGMNIALSLKGPAGRVQFWVSMNNDKISSQRCEVQLAPGPPHSIELALLTNSMPNLALCPPVFVTVKDVWGNEKTTWNSSAQIDFSVDLGGSLLPPDLAVGRKIRTGTNLLENVRISLPPAIKRPTTRVTLSAVAKSLVKGPPPTATAYIDVQPCLSACVMEVFGMTFNGMPLEAPDPIVAGENASIALCMYNELGEIVGVESGALSIKIGDSSSILRNTDSNRVWMFSAPSKVGVYEATIQLACDVPLEVPIRFRVQAGQPNEWHIIDPPPPSVASCDPFSLSCVALDRFGNVVTRIASPTVEIENSKQAALNGSHKNGSNGNGINHHNGSHSENASFDSPPTVSMSDDNNGVGNEGVVSISLSIQGRPGTSLQLSINGGGLKAAVAPLSIIAGAPHRIAVSSSTFDIASVDHLTGVTAYIADKASEVVVAHDLRLRVQLSPQIRRPQDNAAMFDLKAGSDGFFHLPDLRVVASNFSDRPTILLTAEGLQRGEIVLNVTKKSNRVTAIEAKWSSSSVPAGGQYPLLEITRLETEDGAVPFGVFEGKRGKFFMSNGVSGDLPVDVEKADARTLKVRTPILAPKAVGMLRCVIKFCDSEEFGLAVVETREMQLQVVAGRHDRFFALFEKERFVPHSPHAIAADSLSREFSMTVVAGDEFSNIVETVNEMIQVSIFVQSKLSCRLEKRLVNGRAEITVPAQKLNALRWNFGVQIESASLPVTELTAIVTDDRRCAEEVRQLNAAIQDCEDRIVSLTSRSRGIVTVPPLTRDDMEKRRRRDHLRSQLEEMAKRGPNLRPLTSPAGVCDLIFAHERDIEVLSAAVKTDSLIVATCEEEREARHRFKSQRIYVEQVCSELPIVPGSPDYLLRLPQIQARGFQGYIANMVVLRRPAMRPTIVYALVGDTMVFDTKENALAHRADAVRKKQRCPTIVTSDGFYVGMGFTQGLKVHGRKLSPVPVELTREYVQLHREYEELSSQLGEEEQRRERLIAAQREEAEIQIQIREKEEQLQMLREKQQEWKSSLKRSREQSTANMAAAAGGIADSRRVESRRQ